MGATQSQVVPGSELSIEYTKYKEVQQQLENVEHALTTTMDIIESSAWAREIAGGAVSFTTSLHTLYPADDDLRQLFGRTLEEATALERRLQSDTTFNANLQQIKRMVRGYLEGIKTLKIEYPKVEEARRKYELSKKRTAKYNHRDKNDPKKVHVLAIQDRAWGTYSSMLEDTLNRMDTTYEKSSCMFRATFVAYWIIQRRITEAVWGYFQPAFKYAEDNEADEADVFATTAPNSFSLRSGSSAPSEH